MRTRTCREVIKTASALKEKLPKPEPGGWYNKDRIYSGPPDQSDKAGHVSYVLTCACRYGNERRLNHEELGKSDLASLGEQ